MIKLTKEQILLLHTQLIEITGGSDGIRDISLLESVLENHVMIDGNKRIGCHVSLFGIKWL